MDLCGELLTMFVSTFLALFQTGMTTIMFENAKSRGKTVKAGQLAPLQRHGVSEEVKVAPFTPQRCLIDRSHSSRSLKWRYS